MSLRETVLDAIVAAVQTCAPFVARSRGEQLPALPAIIVRPQSATRDPAVIGVRQSQFSVALEIYAAGDIPDQAADAVLDAIDAALDRPDPLGLGAAAQLLPDRTWQWAFAPWDNGQVVLSLTFDLREQP